MKHRTSDHHHHSRHAVDMNKHHHHRYQYPNDFELTVTERKAIHKLIDVPPYPSIRFTPHGFEAFRSKDKEEEEERDGRGKHDTMNYPLQHSSHGYFGNPYDEDVDAEAEQFIRQEHSKFERAKSSFMKY